MALGRVVISSLFLVCFLVSPVRAVEDFSLHRLGDGTGPTLLVVGGIQGDEPGGFSAAALLTTHYTITKGQVWVVPDLNFPSILTRSRGDHGDMNRKFAFVDAADPDYMRVRRIQGIIVDPQVDVILNLHDGSGFYRPTYENPRANPRRWGQCIIIDQESLDGHSFGHLGRMAEQAAREANAGLLKPEHRYHMKNTRTREGDAEMEKTLSYFAVRNGKPAFGIEASKDFTTEFRTYYHIHVLESFMRQMGIEFTRDFPLTPQGVKTAINTNVAVALFDGLVVLPLDNARPRLTYVPMPKGGDLTARFTKPLLAVLPEGEVFRVAYGNRTLTRLVPQYMDFDRSVPEVTVLADGGTRTVPVGSVLQVRDSFLVKGIDGVRVNAIGALREKADGSECEVTLRKKDFQPRFSVDKGGSLYRVEMYKGKAFAGMFLVRFGKGASAAEETLTAVRGEESPFGF